MSNSPQVFTAFVNDGYIYERDPYMREQPRIIGVITNMFETVSEENAKYKDKCTMYYNKLVEAGIIVPPKSPEQLSEEQGKVLKEILDGFKMLNNRLEKLESKEIVINEHTENI